jgi:FdhE protein
MTGDPLLEAAERRWAQIAADRPDLRPPLVLNTRLIGRQIALLDDPAVVAAAQPLPPDLGAISLRLRSGLPLLDETTIADPPAAAVAAVADFGAALEDTPAREAVGRVVRTLGEAVEDVRAAMRCSMLRDVEGLTALGRARGLNVQILWLLSELATAPLACLRQAELARHEVVAPALEQWNEATCPGCGSWPVMAEYFHGARLSCCGYCGRYWEITPDRCSFCGEQGAPFRTVVPNPEQPGRRIELCLTCRGYLKTIDVAVPLGFPLVAIEDFASNDLDTAAHHHGFRRPGIKPA